MTPGRDRFVVVESPESYMRAALAEADLAAEHDDVPVGAVAVDGDGRILARAHNRREADRDPTAHAEILCLRAAARALGTWHLEPVTLFVTLEPCAMCAGAMVNARLGRLVYGAADPKAGYAGSLGSIPEDDRLNHRLPVESGLLAETCGERLRTFFRARR